MDVVEYDGYDDDEDGQLTAIADALRDSLGGDGAGADAREPRSGQNAASSGPSDPVRAGHHALYAPDPAPEPQADPIRGIFITILGSSSLPFNEKPEGTPYQEWAMKIFKTN